MAKPAATPKTSPGEAAPANAGAAAPDKPAPRPRAKYSSVVYVHGIGSQRRYEEKTQGRPLGLVWGT